MRHGYAQQTFLVFVLGGRYFSALYLSSAFLKYHVQFNGFIAGQGLKLNLNSNSDEPTLVTVFIQLKVLYEYVVQRQILHERNGKGAYATILGFEEKR